VLNELAPRSERNTGHRLVMKFGLSGALNRENEAGVPFDVVILPPDALSDLANKTTLHRACHPSSRTTTALPGPSERPQKEPETANALIGFLTGPSAAPVLKAKGMEFR
jgi:ABC-type molybdate transport system substrate-binding protein